MLYASIRKQAYSSSHGAPAPSRPTSARLASKGRRRRGQRRYACYNTLTTLPCHFFSFPAHRAHPRRHTHLEEGERYPPPRLLVRHAKVSDTVLHDIVEHVSIPDLSRNQSSEARRETRPSQAEECATGTNSQPSGPLGWFFVATRDAGCTSSREKKERSCLTSTIATLGADARFLYVGEQRCSQ